MKSAASRNPTVKNKCSEKRLNNAFMNFMFLCMIIAFNSSDIKTMTMSTTESGHDAFFCKDLKWFRLKTKLFIFISKLESTACVRSTG